MTKIYLITGFLGSGKSTFINSLLLESHKKIGVLVNEFGKISVDTITLSRNDIDLIELTNGSIFCACLKDKFIDSLLEMIKRPIEEIYIEASGLSDPSNILTLMGLIRKKNPDKEIEFSGVICIVDALYFLKQLDVMESVRRQIKHSYFILINKIDLVQETELIKIRKAIKDINPNALIEQVSYGKTDVDLRSISLFNIAEEDTTNTVSSRAQSMMMEFKKTVSVDVLREFFKECAPYIFRAKGYCEIDDEIYKIDVVNDTVHIEKEQEHIEIKSSELNKIVLLLPKGLEGIKRLSSVSRELFGSDVLLSS